MWTRPIVIRLEIGTESRTIFYSIRICFRQMWLIHRLENIRRQKQTDRHEYRHLYFLPLIINQEKNIVRTVQSKTLPFWNAKKEKEGKYILLN